MRLIHCADLHLDSKMEANLSAAQARERKAELLHTFARLADVAREQKVDGVLIAGDLFDSRRVSAATANLVLDIMEQAAEVEFFYLRGNHDESRDIFGGRKLPENVRTFGHDWTYYRRGDVVIAGLELDRENWGSMYDTLDLRSDTANVVLLHGQDAAQPGAENIAIPRLRGRNIDYLALGHIHSYQKSRLDSRGVWAYCGCLEGRGFDECGEKGFVVLDIRPGQVKTAFVPFAARQLREVVVDITECVTITQLQAAAEAAAAGISPESLVKFTLVGAYTPETQKDLTYLSKILSRRFWFVKIKDDSRFRLERGDYAHDASLKGAFIRLVMASGRSEAEKAKIICAGLQALAGEEVAI
ncbi:MAG: DNA repair exonuclease [Oscillospiraceae bacterium]|nr:DNA repair exonuclease [Oscillospiraceae bacterium]